MLHVIMVDVGCKTERGGVDGLTEQRLCEKAETPGHYMVKKIDRELCSGAAQNGRCK
jgi:hypothetical protein